MMGEHSRINKTGASEFCNIREEENEDDNEFFAGTDDSQNDEDDEQQIKTGEDAAAIDADTGGAKPDSMERSAGHRSGATNENVLPSQIASSSIPSHSVFTHSQQPISTSLLPSRRHPITNLSKITEAPDDEFSFSFKHGDNARELFNTDHKKLLDQNHLRLPSGSFHESRYSMKYSWEESVLAHRYQNHINRSEMNLSKIQTTIAKTPSQPTSKNLAHSSPGDADAGNTTAKKPFISGTRYALYFGFRRLGVDSEEALWVHNIHPEEERLGIRCWIKASTSNKFQLVSPLEKKYTILEWDHYLKVVVSFLPTALEHSRNNLYVECKSRHATQKYMFKIHGFGGRAVIQPSLSDPSGAIFTSINGHYQLVVKNLANFHFILRNQGNRSAFASIFIFDHRGELPDGEVVVNTRNIILDKKDQEDEKVIEVRYLGSHSNQPTPRASTQVSAPSTCSTGTTQREEAVLKIVAFWGEERQRQRLKQFEKKLNGTLTTFGRNFTKLLNFPEEGDHWQKEGKVEDFVCEEEYYYFDENVRLLFIDVHEQKRVERSNTPTASAASSTVGQQQARVGSVLSIVSSDGRQELLQTHHTIVKLDPDDTLTAGACLANSVDDDTLINF